MVHTISGIRILPADAIWNRVVSDLPVHASSAAYITAIGGASTKLRAKVSTPAFSTPNGWGIPLNLVTSSTPTYSPTFTFSGESDAGPYPIPASPLIEEPAGIGSDKHYVALNTDTGVLYEIQGLSGTAPTFSGLSGALWSMNSDAMRTSGWTSADAAGFPILPGLLLYDEVATGLIPHALRVAVPNGSGTFIWPASHADGSTVGMPPHGTRFRLLASVDLSGYSAINQTILTALKQYGCLLCDVGTTAEMKLYGAGDTRWNDTDLQVLNTLITAANFEVVDEAATMISSTSMAAHPAYPNYRDTIEPNLVAALNANNLLSHVQLIGPDTTMANDNWLTSASSDLSSTLSGYVRHAFPIGATDISGDSLEVAAKSLVRSIYANDPTAKPIIQGEMGFGAMGPGQSVATYQYGVEMADYAVQLARAGMAALIAYDLDDDMHGTQWGMWQITADTGQPRPWFFPWSLLTQTLVPGSRLYAPAQPTSNDLRVLAARSPQGGWTFVLVNRRATTQNVRVVVPFAPVVSSSLHVYTYSSASPLFVDIEGFPLASGTLNTILPRGFTVSVATSSVLILTEAAATETSVFDVKRPPLQKRR